MRSLFALLSRLYRSLEDYDVVRGIFGGKVGTRSITCAALQAEANSDFAEAVKLYNEVPFLGSTVNLAWDLCSMSTRADCCSYIGLLAV